MRVSDTAKGLLFLMKSESSNPMSHEGGKVFNEIVATSGMSIQATLKHIGRQSKKPKIPEEQKAKERLAKLEESN